MKGLSDFSIVLENGRTSFCGGEILRGQLEVHFEDPAEMRNIKMRFYGEGFSQTDHAPNSANRKPKQKKESIVDLQKVLFGLKDGETGDSVPLHPHGGYRYDFSFMLPKYLPCSFESPKDHEFKVAYIRYFLEAAITVPWKKNVTKEVTINVNEVIDTSLPEYSYRPGCQTQKELGACLPDGTLYIEAYLNDICFNQSGTILITCTAENDSKRIMSSVYAKLFKRSRYRRKRETTTYLEVVSEYFGDRVLPKQTVTWHNLEFKVPEGVGPTITKSNRINVDYFLRVGMYQLFREEIHVDLPIVIGTTRDFLLAKRRTEEELDQELSISVDRLPSDKCDFIEADRRSLRELAEMYKQMPAVGNRPCVQYISGEERRIRRNKIAGSTPRLGVLVESDYFSKGNDRPELSRSSDVLCNEDPRLLENGFLSRRASETNLYAASKSQRLDENGAFLGRSFSAAPRQNASLGNIWSRGNTPRENGAARLSVRKAASHSEIETKQAPVEMTEGKRIASPRKSPVKQQTGRKFASQEKLDMKEVALIASGLSNLRRKGGVKIKAAGESKEGIVKPDGLNQAGKSTGLQRNALKGVERAVEGNEVGDEATLNQNADLKGESSVVAPADTTDRAISEKGNRAADLNQLQSSGSMNNNGDDSKMHTGETEKMEPRKDRKAELVHETKGQEKMANALPNKSTALQRKTSSSGEGRISRSRETLKDEDLAKNAAKQQRLVRSKAKVSSVNAFSGAAKASKLVGNGIAKTAAKSPTKNGGLKARKAEPSDKEKSMNSRIAGNIGRKSSAQVEESDVKDSLAGKNAKGKEVGIVGDENRNSRINNGENNQRKEALKQRENGLKGSLHNDILNNNNDNNNLDRKMAVEETVLADANEMEVETSPEFNMADYIDVESEVEGQVQGKEKIGQRNSMLIDKEQASNNTDMRQAVNGELSRSKRDDTLQVYGSSSRSAETTVGEKTGIPTDEATINGSNGIIPQESHPSEFGHRDVSASANANGGMSAEGEKFDVEANDIVPKFHDGGVESSAFRFQDLEKEFTEEGNNGIEEQTGAPFDQSQANESLSNESLINKSSTNESVISDDEASNLQRAPSLDEFELFESQLEDDSIMKGSHKAMSTLEEDAETEAAATEASANQSAVEEFAAKVTPVKETGNDVIMETAVKKTAAKEAPANGTAAKETAAKRTTAKEIVTKGTAAKGVVAKETIAKEATGKETTSKGANLNGITAKEAAAKVITKKEAASKRTAAKETVTMGTAAKEVAAKEAAAKEAATKDIITKGTAVKEVAAKEAAAKDIITKGTAVKEVAAKGAAAKDIITKGTAVKDVATKGATVKGTAARDIRVEGQAGKEFAAKEAATKDIITKGTAVKEVAAKGAAAKDIITKGTAVKDVATKGATVKGTAARDIRVEGQAGKEFAAKEAAAKDIITKGTAVKEVAAKGAAAKDIITKGTAVKDVATKGATVKGTAARDIRVEGQAGKEVAAKGAATKDIITKGTAVKDVATKGATVKGTAARDIRVEGQAGKEIAENDEVVANAAAMEEHGFYDNDVANTALSGQVDQAENIPRKYVTQNEANRRGNEDVRSEEIRRNSADNNGGQSGVGASSWGESKTSVNGRQASLTRKAAETAEMVRNTSIKDQRGLSSTKTDNSINGDVYINENDDSDLNGVELMNQSSGWSGSQHTEMRAGNTNGQGSQVDASESSGLKGIVIQPSTSEFQAARNGSFVTGINNSLELSESDGVEANRGSHTTQQRKASLTTRILRDENKNEIGNGNGNGNGNPAAKLSWRQASTKIHTVSKLENSRKRSVVKIQVLGKSDNVS